VVSKSPFITEEVVFQPIQDKSNGTGGPQGLLFERIVDLEAIAASILREERLKAKLYS